jgi:hypothetical protein
MSQEQFWKGKNKVWEWVKAVVVDSSTDIIQSQEKLIRKWKGKKTRRKVGKNLEVKMV